MDVNTATLNECQRRGWAVDRAETWNAYSRTKHDMFEFIDYVALGKKLVAIQATSQPNMRARADKIQQLATAKNWLYAGGRILVWGWSQQRNRWYDLEEWELSWHQWDDDFTELVRCYYRVGQSQITELWETRT